MTNKLESGSQRRRACERESRTKWSRVGCVIIALLAAVIWVAPVLDARQSKPSKSSGPVTTSSGGPGTGGTGTGGGFYIYVRNSYP
jgi:hypothetical protein